MCHNLSFSANFSQQNSCYSLKTPRRSRLILVYRQLFVDFSAKITISCIMRNSRVDNIRELNRAQVISRALTASSSSRLTPAFCRYMRNDFRGKWFPARTYLWLLASTVAGSELSISAMARVIFGRVSEWLHGAKTRAKARAKTHGKTRANIFWASTVIISLLSQNLCDVTFCMKLW